MTNNRKTYFLILCACSAWLFLINIKSSHDWGDDFAQYIHRAKNVVEGISQQQTGLVFNDRYPIFSPPAFTMGFPLLLSPVYYFFGNNIVAFNYLMSFFLALVILFSYMFLCRYMKPVYAFLISLALLFNPLLIQLKAEIISDLPFTLFLLMCTLAYFNLKENWLKIIALGLLAGFLISIRSVGFAFIIALFINESIVFFQSPGLLRKRRWMMAGVLVPVIAGTFYYLINYVFFNLSGGAIHSPSRIFTGSHLYDIILHNLNYYMLVWQNLVYTDAENTYGFISTLAKSVLLSAIVWGFIIRIRSNFSFTEIFVIVYMIVLLTYPYSNSGIRFLIPLLPFLMIYLYEWLKAMCVILKFSRWFFIAGLILSVYLLYKHELKKIMDNENFITEGPQRLTSKDVFSFIRENTKENERIVFSKPMVLSLYTNRESFAINPKEETSIIPEQIKSNRLNYILTCKNLPNPALESYIENYPGSVELIKSNDVFYFYRIKD